MKIFQTMKTWLRQWSASRKEKSEARRLAEVENESNSRLQVREFKGGVYLCYDNIPLLDEGSLKHPLPNTLESMRNNYRTWRMSSPAR